MNERERIVQLFFFGFLALIAYEMYALFEPFLTPIAWAILLAFLVHPALVELHKFVKNRTTSAIILTGAVAIGVILPAIWMSDRLAVEGQRLYAEASDMVKSGGVKTLDQTIQNSSVGPIFRRFMGHG